MCVTHCVCLCATELKKRKIYLSNTNETWHESGEHNLRNQLCQMMENRLNERGTEREREAGERKEGRKEVRHIPMSNQYSRLKY